MFMWIVGGIVTVQIGVNYFMAQSFSSQLRELETRTETSISRVEARVESNDAQLAAVDQDIRAILVGIEQVKARLGIVENE